MTTIQVLGTGCPKCAKLTANAHEAIEMAGIEATVEKISKLDDILAFGVMMTPALAIDGDIKAAGKVLTPEQIRDLL